MNEEQKRDLRAQMEGVAPHLWALLNPRLAAEMMQAEKERVRNIQYYLAGNSDAPLDPARFDTYAREGAKMRADDARAARMRMVIGWVPAFDLSAIDLATSVAPEPSSRDQARQRSRADVRDKRRGLRRRKGKLR